MSGQLEWLYNPRAKPAKELSKHDQQMIQLGWDAHKTLRLDRPELEEANKQEREMLFEKIEASRMTKTCLYASYLQEECLIIRKQEWEALKEGKC